MVAPDSSKNRHKQRVIPKEFLLKRLDLGYTEITECFNRLKKPSNPRQMIRTKEIVIKLKTEIATILNKVPKRGITTKSEQELVCNAVQSVSTRAKEDISALIKSSDKTASGIQNIMRRKISEVLSKVRSEITEKFEVKESDGNANILAANAVTAQNITPKPVIEPGLDYDLDQTGLNDETDIIDTSNLINKSELLFQHYEIVVFRYFKQVLEKIFKQIKLKIVSEKKRFYPKFIPVSIQEFNVLFKFADDIKNNIKEILPEQITLYFSEVDNKLIVNDPLSLVSEINDLILNAAEVFCSDLEEMDIEMRPVFVKRILEGCSLDHDDVICAVNNNVMPEEQDSAFDTTDIILNGLLYSQIPAENQKDTLKWLEQREMDETEKDIIKEKLVVLKITDGIICPEKITEITDYINDQMYCGLPIRNSEQIQKYIAEISGFVEEKTENDIEIQAITEKTTSVAEAVPEPKPMPAPVSKPATADKQEHTPAPASEIIVAPNEIQTQTVSGTPITLTPIPAVIIENIRIAEQKPEPVTINETNELEANDATLSPDIQSQIIQILQWFESLPDPVHKKLYWKIADFFYDQLKNNANKLPASYVILYLKRFQLLKKHYSSKVNSFSVPDKDIPRLFEIPSAIPIEIIETDKPNTPKIEELKIVDEIIIRLEKVAVSADKVITIQNSLLKIQENLEILTSSNKEYSEKAISAQQEFEDIEKKLAALKIEIKSIAASDDFDSDLLKQKVDEAQGFKIRKVLLEKEVLDYKQRISMNEQNLNMLMEELKKYQEEIENESSYANKRTEVIKRLKALLEFLKK